MNITKTPSHFSELKHIFRLRSYHDLCFVLHKRICIFSILCLILIGNVAFALPNQIPILPVPTWVSLKWQYHSKHQQSENRCLLFEKQINVEEEEAFQHTVYKLSNDEDVQEKSTVKICFNPSYQALTFHILRVYRNGEDINKLEEIQPKIIQREENIEAHFYDGYLTAIIFLEDMREGDILEYAYSLKGFNPIIKPHFCYLSYLQFSEPLEKYGFSIIVSDQKKLFIKDYFSSIEFTMKEIHPGQRRYSWELSSIPGRHLELDQPDWYDDFPLLAISSFPNWKAVAEWGKNLYELPDPLSLHCSQEMLELVNQWKEECSTKEEQALKAVRFVQDKVRYLSFESGIHSFKPNHPVEVFKNRFGDCKDKTQLLRIFFVLLDIESYPTLVNTQLTKSIINYHPTHAAFNHAILQASINGKVYWIDSTMNQQGGSLEENFYPHVHYGLVLKADSEQLVSIPAPPFGSAKFLTTFFLYQEKGVGMEMVSTYQGHEADSFRRYCKQRGVGKIAKDYENYYACLFGKLKSTQPLQMEDDREKNQFVTKEFYYIDHLLEEDEKKKILKFSFTPFNLNAYLKDSIDPERKTPLHHPFPLDRTDSYKFIKVDGSNWATSNWHDQIAHKAFNFEVDVSCLDNELTYEFCYQSLDDHVRVEDIPEHRELISKAQDHSYTIKIPLHSDVVDENTPSKRMKIMYAFFAAIGLCYALKRVFRLL